MIGKLRVTALYHYPLKSCRGIALAAAHVTPHGLEQDRRWMVVDGKGRFLSQRRFPAMALIEAEPLGAGLILRAPGMPELSVAEAAGEPLAVRIWGHEGRARDAGEAAAAWLSGYLGQACRLVGPGAGFERPVDPVYDRFDSRVLFSDGFPFLLISQASLDQLNALSAQPIPMDRFRPNIVVGGCPPHAEDGWRTLQIGELVFHVVKPCSRCTIPTVDQMTGERSAEPTRTLSTYRRGEDGHIYFGQNLVHETKAGMLRVGDPVMVLA